MKFITAAIIGALLLVSLAVPMSSTSVAAADASTVAVLFDFGDGRVMWYDVNLTSGMDSFEATEQAASALGLELVAQNWGNATSPDMFIDTINGRGFDPETYEFWGFWTWNASSDNWDMASVGPSKKLASEAGAIAMYYSSSMSGPVATPEHRYTWTSFRQNVLNTGAQLNKAPNNLTLLWEDDLANGAIDSSVIGANGNIYVITGGIMNMTTWGYDTNSTVFCLNSTGKVWSAEIGTGYQVAAPLLYGDMVIVPSANGKVYAFDAEDGAALWTFDTGSALTNGVTSSPIAYRDNIVFAAGNGKVYSLFMNGTQAWSRSVASVIYSSSPAAYNGTLYIGADDGKLHALASDGTGENWSLALGGKVRGSPILMDDQIVVSYVNYTGNSPSGGGLAAVSYSGQLLWQTSTAVSPASAALTNGGFALMTSDGMSLIGFDGAKVWNISLGTSFAGAAATAVAGSIFAVTNEEHSRLVVVSDDGEIYWQQELAPAQYALSAPTVIGNILYVTSDNGHVYAYLLKSVAPSTAAFTSVTNGLTVTFTATTPSNGSLYYYSWNFGDGNTSNGMVVNHTYAKAGDYTVMLFIANPAGDLSTTYRSVSPVSSSDSGIPMWTWLVLVVAIVAIVSLAVLMMRRKK